MIHADLSPDERHQIGLSVLTAAAITLAAGLVNWGLEEAKRLLAA